MVIDMFKKAAPLGWEHNRYWGDWEIDNVIDRVVNDPDFVAAEYSI